MKFRRNFKKMVYGFEEVEAKTLKEAQKKFNEGDYDIFDNKEDTEYEKIHKE